MLAVNERGLRIGEDHQNAVLTNREVEMLLELRITDRLGYRRLSAMFDVSKAQVRRIISGQQRSQLVAVYRVADAKKASES